MSLNRINVLEIGSELALPSDVLEKVSLQYGSDVARDCAMATSVGGIGPLLKDRITSQAEKHVPVIGVSLLYESVWAQLRDENGHIPLLKKWVGDPLRTVLKPTNFNIDLKIFSGETVRVEVYECQIGHAKCYFLSNPPITNVVYPGPVDAPEGIKDTGFWTHELKLKQNWLLGRGALSLCKKLGFKPHITILSESPAIFSHHALFQDEFQKDPYFSETRYIYNDHTPLEYAHPLWDQQTLQMVKLDPASYENQQPWIPKTKHVDVTTLAVQHCHGTCAVSKKHGDLLKSMKSLKSFEGKIHAITNGVHPAYWQSPEFRNYDKLSEEKLSEIKLRKKRSLLLWIAKSAFLSPEWAQNAEQKNIGLLTRRITPYKRLDVLNQLLSDKTLKERFLKLDFILLVGGRIHQHDQNGHTYAANLITALHADVELRDKILFVENFNIWEAPLLYQGADVALMISDNKREASATGFMKAQLNGAAVIATPDGAIPETVDFYPKLNANGIEIPYIKNEPTAKGLMDALETFNSLYKIPQHRTAFIKSALAKSPEVNIHRATDEMINLYHSLLSSDAVSA